MRGSATARSARSSSSVNSTCAVPMGLPSFRVLPGVTQWYILTRIQSESKLLPRAQRRAAILHGAALAFASSGFADTSMDDVGTACGVTKLIVYRHFGSKEELYRE